MFRRRWSLASKALALLAIATGGAAFLLVRGYAARLEALRPVTGDVIPVLVAARELPRGTVLAQGDLTPRGVPSAYAPPGAIRSTDDAVGRVLAAELGPGEALTRTRLAAAGAGPVAALVPSGLRAFPVAVGIRPAPSARATSSTCSRPSAARTRTRKRWPRGWRCCG